MPVPEALLSFWIGPLDAGGMPAAARVDAWFAADPDLDARIRRELGPQVEAARAGRLETWAATPRGRLALVIALDQLSRNLHRGTPEAFSADPRALAHARAALAASEDRIHAPIERIFLYLPFEHAEDPEAQAVSVARFEALAREAPAGAEPLFETFADYARRHRDVIARFGRFPHRNAVLGRPSSAEELAFLEEPGSAF